ncbi:MAG: hypothetical protein AAF518_05145 [Spirochaetota bacterium]
MDRSFDDSSEFLALYKKDSEVPVVVLRLTLKKVGQRMPLEWAKRENGRSYSLLDSRIAELNSFVYKDIKPLNFFFHKLSERVADLQIDCVHALVDSRSKRYIRLYQKSGFIYSERYKEQIFFDSFCWSDNTPVKWAIMELPAKRQLEFWGEKRVYKRTEVNLPVNFLDENDKNLDQVFINSLSKGGARLKGSHHLKANSKCKIVKQTMEILGKVLRVHYNTSTEESTIHVQFHQYLTNSEFESFFNTEK